MRTWRRKALEYLPDLKADIEAPGSTPMGLFFELLPRVRDAHDLKNNAELRRIYSFATWCAREQTEELWNAAYVGFFEHLVDSVNTRNAIAEWVPKDIFEETLSLFATRMSDAALQDLIAKYNRKNRTKLSHRANSK